MIKLSHPPQLSKLKRDDKVGVIEVKREVVDNPSTIVIKKEKREKGDKDGRLLRE